MGPESDLVVRCTWCGSRDVRSSAPRGIWDGIMAVVQFTAYRCRGCGSRFYRRAPRKPEDAEQGQPAENHKDG